MMDEARFLEWCAEKGIRSNLASGLWEAASNAGEEGFVALNKAVEAGNAQPLVEIFRKYKSSNNAQAAPQHEAPEPSIHPQEPQFVNETPAVEEKPKSRIQDIAARLFQMKNKKAGVVGKPSMAGKPTIGGQSGAKSKPSMKTILIMAGAGAVVLLIVAAIAFFALGSSGTPADGGFSANSPETSDNLGISDVVTPTDTVTDPTNPNMILPTSPSGAEAASNNADRQFWFGMRSIKVPELSPGNLGGQLDAKTVIGIILMLVLTVFAFFEGKGRAKGQQGSLFFSMAGVLAGWFAMPIMVFMAGASAGMFWVSSLVLVCLWVTAATTIKSQSDLTPSIVALAVFTASLFYVGKLEAITAIGALFGFTWPAWVGVTTISGAITLMMTGRATQAILTMVIFFLSLTVIYFASREVGKKHSKWAPYLIGFAIILLFSLLNWGLGAGVVWLVASTKVPVMVEVILRILAPLLAWLLSLLGSIIIGASLGDVEVGMRENRQRLGLEKTGTFIENMSDFMILGTIIPLFLGVIIIFF